MVLSDDLPAVRGACSATSILLLLVTWLLPSHARACGNAALCGDHIDAFFLPLIASSVTGAPATGAATPLVDMLSWWVRVEQQLLTGRMGDMQSSMSELLRPASKNRVMPVQGRAARNRACRRFLPTPGLLACGILTMAWTFRPLPGGL